MVLPTSGIKQKNRNENLLTVFRSSTLFDRIYEPPVLTFHTTNETRLPPLSNGSLLVVAVADMTKIYGVSTELTILYRSDR